MYKKILEEIYLARVFGEGYVQDLEYPPPADYSRLSVDLEGKSFYATGKLCGVRAFAFVDGKRVIMLSEKGSAIEHVEPVVDKITVPNKARVVLDGYLVDYNWESMTCRELRNETARHLNHGKGKENLVYIVFDMLTLPEFMNHDCERDYYTRYGTVLDVVVPNDKVRPIYYGYAGNDKKNLIRMMELYTHAGWEGAFIKLFDGKYGFDGKPDLIEVRDLIKTDYPILEYGADAKGVFITINLHGGPFKIRETLSDVGIKAMALGLKDGKLGTASVLHMGVGLDANSNLMLKNAYIDKLLGG